MNRMAGKKWPPVTPLLTVDAVVRTGGGIVLDIIELKDGRGLAISDEVVVLYSDMDDLMQGETRTRVPLFL